MEKIAFAFRIAPDRVGLIDELARSVTESPEVDMVSREFGMDRVTAWLQEGVVPIVVTYSEWKVDPVEGFGELVSSPEAAGALIRSALSQVMADPGDVALEVPAGRSQLMLDWSASDGTRGADLRCYARFVPRERALAIKEFLADLRSDRALLAVYSRLRERAGMRRVSLWAEDVGSEEVLLIDMYESDDLDATFAKLAASDFDLDRHMEFLAAHSFGWTPASMPEVRRVYHWTS
jgi:hypothetical protein